VPPDIAFARARTAAGRPARMAFAWDLQAGS